MRKWTLRIGTFILSLIMGSAASFTWNAHRLISLCDINANPEYYAGRRVRLRVKMFNSVVHGVPLDSDRLISAGSLCAGKDDDPPWASVDLAPEQIDLVPETVAVWRGEHDRKYGKSYMTEAILIGRFEAPSGTHCFAPKYNISQARIERVIATHEFENGEQAAQWLKSQSR